MNIPKKNVTKILNDEEKKTIKDEGRINIYHRDIA